MIEMSEAVMNKMTKAELIELVQFRDEKVEEIRTKYMLAKVRYEQDIGKAYGEIAKLQSRLNKAERAFSCEDQHFWKLLAFYMDNSTGTME